MLCDRIVIGLTGPFGSGCTYVAKEFLEKNGYRYLSLSNILRDLIKVDFPDKIGSDRTTMQDLGDEIRKKHGNSILAQKALEIIDNNNYEKWIVDSIRNSHEVEYFKNKLGRFFLIATWADINTRWERVHSKYNNIRTNFETDDKRDNDGKIDNGQQVSICYKMSDIILLNNISLINGSEDYNNFDKIIKRYIDIIEEKRVYIPSETESLMAMAYATSMRSSCNQRKVGALLVDDFGNVFSSGYNEVPNSQRSCKSKYGQCYRKRLINDFSESISRIINDEDKQKQILQNFKEKFKILDYCRALHAEENAIINVTRLGLSQALVRSTLFTTTYPCKLCANKIVQVGVKKVVYFEPYPMEDAKEILNEHGINQEPFEGVTFNGYFRLMEVLV